MIWLSREFDFAEYAPYQDSLEKLLMANAPRYAQFIMVSTTLDDPKTSNYFVGLPDNTFSPLFDGFAPVAESDLPRVIDSVLIADTTTSEFTSRFETRGRGDRA
jgi:hypothetical protein